MRLCEARYVAKMPDAARNAYIAGVSAQRGQASAKALDDLVDPLAEAYKVMAMPSLERRRQYIERVRLKRGELAAVRLKEIITREWGNKNG